MTKREWLCAAGLGAALLAAGGCDVLNLDAHAAGVEGTFERTLTVSGPVTLEVRTGSGDIQIRQGPDTSVHLIGRIKAQASGLGDKPEERVAQIQAHPPVEQAGNSVHLGRTDDDPLYRRVSISYELTVPAQTKVQARSGSGGIGIALTAGDVDARTGSGDINLLGTTGTFEAHTGSGDVHAGRVAGWMKASTGSGDVKFSLPDGAAFNLDVQTGSGSIHTTHPVTIMNSRRRNRLEGTVRGGGPMVDIKTGSGSVTIE